LVNPNDPNTGTASAISQYNIGIANLLLGSPGGCWRTIQLQRFDIRRSGLSRKAGADKFVNGWRRVESMMVLPSQRTASWEQMRLTAVWQPKWFIIGAAQIRKVK
jgi:hypothetical protein